MQLQRLCTLCSVATVTLLICAHAPAVEPLPDYWIAISVRDAELDAGPQAQPPTPSEAPIATVRPGETIELRAKIVGGRRAYMMWPETYANIGENTTIEVRGFDRLVYSVQNEAFSGRSEWTVVEELYQWDTAGAGALSPIDQSHERVAWTAPTQPGSYPLTVTGNLRLHLRRQAPGGVREQEEESGQLSRAVVVAVAGGQQPQDASWLAPGEHMVRVVAHSVGGAASELSVKIVVERG